MATKQEQKDFQSAPQLLNGLIEALGQASGACGQLIHQMDRDARWILMRQAIDLAREGCMSVATFEAQKITLIKPI